MLLFKCENGIVVNLEKVLYLKTLSSVVSFTGPEPLKGVNVLAIFGFGNEDYKSSGEHGVALATFRSKKEAQDFIERLAKIMATESNKFITVDDVKNSG